MNSNNRKSHYKNRTKAIAAAAPVTMAPAIVTAAILLSGLSLIGSYPQPVLAQQAMTESVGTTGAGGGTTGGGTVCILITSNGATAGNTTIPTTTDAAAQGGNATTTTVGGAGEGNQPEGGFDIEDAITAFQNNGTQGAMLTGAGGTTGAGGGTTGGGTVCILITRSDTAGNTTTPTPTTTMDGADMGGGNATTTTSVATGGAGEEGNGSLPQIRTHIQDAITAFQNSDAQGVMNSLDLADKALGGAGLVQDNNMTAAETAAEGATNMTTTGGAP